MLGPPDRTRDFLCGDCAHPDKIIHVCANCRTRIELRPNSETLRTLREYCPELPDHPGITVVVKGCEQCWESEEPSADIEFYAIRPSEFH